MIEMAIFSLPGTRIVGKLGRGDSVLGGLC